MKTNESCLITGGCGFIGVNLIQYFLKKHPHIKIRVLDNLTVGSRENLAEVCNYVEGHTTNALNHNFSPSSVELVVGDIRDKEACLQACKGIDTVIHLAAHTNVVTSVEDPCRDFEINVVGTLNLLDACIKSKVSRFIFASSNATLGDQTPPSNEEKLPKPLSPYGASKLACEAYCSSFYHSYGLKTVALRFSNVYGSHCLHKNSVIARFIKDAILRKTLTIYGDGSQTRDFIHVEDLCEVILKIILNENAATSFEGDVFQIGTGKEMSIRDLADHIKGLFNDGIKTVFEPERKGEIKRNYSDISKARRLLGFNPSTSIEEGIKGVYDWVASQKFESLAASLITSGSE